MIAPLAHELIVDNPKQIAIVKLEEYWFDDNRWEIYLPDGRYRLCLATRGIDDDRFGFPVVVKTTSLTSGRHHLALEQKLDKDTWRITALWDEAKLLAVEEPKDWNIRFGWSGGARYSRSEQLSSEKPAILIRRRFTRADSRARRSYRADRPTA